MSTTYTAVLDRIEGDRAVLLLEADGEVVDEHVVPVDRLPEHARTAGAVLRVTLGEGAGDGDGPVEAVEHDPEATAERTRRAQDRFDRLASRPPGAGDGGASEGDDGTSEGDDGAVEDGDGPSEDDEAAEDAG